MARIGWTVDVSGTEFAFGLSKHFFDQSAPPTVGDDQLDGASTGSQWFVTSGGSAGNVYVCRDPSTGAAVWDLLNGGGSGGITSLNALTDASQTFATVNDTNVTLGIVSAAGEHTFTLGWAGTLADGRIASAATWNAKEPAITATTSADYYRGDKTFQPLNAAAVGAQPLDTTLTNLAAANWATDSLPIGTGTDTVGQVTFAANRFPAKASTGALVAKTITDFALTILDDADGPAVRTTIGAGTATSPLTTKGDIWVFSTINARKAVGGTGALLVADSTDATGLAWTSGLGWVESTKSISVAGTAGGIIAVDQGTLTTGIVALQVASIWNQGSTTFKASTITITDTASAAASLFVDYLIGASSKYKVDKTGKITSAVVAHSFGGFTMTMVASASIGKPPLITVYGSGSGTHTTAAGCLYMLRELVGGGGGGAGSGTTPGAAAAGGATTFGVLSAGGGAAGSTAGAVAVGGTASGGDRQSSGGEGQEAGLAVQSSGGFGGSSWFGGGGCPGRAGAIAGRAGSARGAGGGGAGSGITANSGGGGGSGAYLDNKIDNPAASYAYAVGAGGAGGTAGTSGAAGGAGAVGSIRIAEYFS